jgi:hypothetical protein
MKKGKLQSFTRIQMLHTCAHTHIETFAMWKLTNICEQLWTHTRTHSHKQKSWQTRGKSQQPCRPRIQQTFNIILLFILFEFPPNFGPKQWPSSNQRTSQRLHWPVESPFIADRVSSALQLWFKERTTNLILRKPNETNYCTPPSQGPSSNFP